MPPQRHSTSYSPLVDVSLAGWDRLIESVDGAAMLVTIESWLGPGLERYATAEDVWQETLIAAWEAREDLEWRGMAAFRRCLLQIARRRLADLSDEQRAAKRGGGRLQRRSDLRRRTGSLDRTQSTDGGSHYAGPLDHTSPDRIAVDRERARAMLAALTELPPDLEPVLRLRLFEDRPIADIAGQLGIGASAARYRLRKGLSLFQSCLRAAGGAPTGETSASGPD